MNGQPLPAFEQPDLAHVLRGIRYSGGRKPVCLVGADSQKEQSKRLMDKLNAAADACQPHCFDLPKEAVYISQINDFCRIVHEELHGESFGFVAQLQMKKRFLGWHSVATYESRNGRSFRLIENIDGSTTSFCLNRPYPIIKHMAIQDFSRNWSSYLAFRQGEIDLGKEELLK
ncbi:MAG: hypothetical protein K2W82_02460 [Candidatus Obscuribacterales bacterium]|nr:hypothetical protein [Candidatus Obscuribacterales bacterium]